MELQSNHWCTHGVRFVHRDRSEETLNVVVFYVLDLGHKKVLGRTQVTATYGCLHCKKKRSAWGNLQLQAALLTRAGHAAQWPTGGTHPRQKP